MKGQVISARAGPFDMERILEFEFVRATENAALNAVHWLGRGEKEKGDAAACDAIYGVFDLVDIRGEVVIGEGIKDNAPGIFVGEKLGTWKEGAPRFDIALDRDVDAGGSPEAILTAAALKCLGDDMEVRMWFHNESHRAEVAVQVPPEDLQRVFRINDLVVGESALFCATGITDNALVPGI